LLLVRRHLPCLIQLVFNLRLSLMHLPCRLLEHWELLLYRFLLDRQLLRVNRLPVVGHRVVKY
jgi:hypothetical protein